MTLEEKILAINEPAITKIAGVGMLPTGKADTIENFFVSFVKPRLPNSDVIKQWHEKLMQYTAEENLDSLSCCVRFGNEGGEKASSEGEKGYYKLRRGWLTKSTYDDFEYFFADNFFSSFIYKMALDGFAPASVDELRTVFQQRKFPYGFGFFVDNKINEYKGVVVATGKEPGFLGNYKLSHIFDAGEHFDINGKEYGDASLSKDFYPIGHSDDFLKNSDRIRRMDITYEAKKVITAKFLRFAHPFNYFLTPTKTHQICHQNVYKKDIGEDPRMISYVKQYLETTYPIEYAQFLDRIMWHEDSKTIVATGKERIDITYGLDVNSRGSSKSTMCTEDQALTVAAEYLRNGISMIKLEENVLHLENHKGYRAMSILDSLGIREKKGLLKNSDIDTEISKASGSLKEVLQKMKAKGL